jgi:hypothetical protein
MAGGVRRGLRFLGRVKVKAPVPPTKKLGI